MGPADMDEPGPGEGDVPANAGHSDGDEVAGDGGPAADAAADRPADDAPENTVPDGATADETAPLDGATASAAPADVAPTGAAPRGAAPGGAAGADQPGGSQPGGAAVPVPPGGGHPGRKKKILAWTAGGVAVVLLLALGGAYAVYRHLNGNLHQLDISGDLGTQPVDTHPQAENIMIIGSDTRHDQGKGFGQGLETDQSDTLMIMHIAANRKWVDVMSIPRDSWVNIPACMMGNGQQSNPTTYKINEAFALGNLYGNHTDLGVACTEKTLEADTGIHIDHFVVVNFEGFRDMVNALGGVEECNTSEIDDPKSGLHLKPGHHLLHGLGALAYVRARYTLGNGTDLERIGRQQAFMSSLVERVKSKLLDPLAIFHFLDAATKSITVDSQMGGLHGLYDLAMSVRSLPASAVTFFTLPTYPRSEVVPTDTANVLWTQPEDSTIFQDFINDTPVTGATLQPAKAPKIPAHSVRVTVRNGTTQYGLQDTVGSSLQQSGFHVIAETQGSNTDVTETVIKYHQGERAKARLLASKVPGAVIEQVPGSSPRLTLVLGSDYSSTSQASESTQSVAPTPSPSFSSRTASQNICAS
jgi:LCP family protein required for cell wall assembly